MKMLPKRRSRGIALMRPEMTSMIDVIFLLLIYFLTTTTYTPPESQLSPALQSERVEGGAPADFQPQIIDIALIDGRPGFRLGERVVRDKPALTALLRALPRSSGVFVRASGQVSTEWATAALQSAHDAGFTKVTYVPAP